MEPTRRFLSKANLRFDNAAAMDITETDGGLDTAGGEKVASAGAAIRNGAASAGLPQSSTTSRRLRLIRRFLNGFGVTLALSWVAMYSLETVNDNPIGLSHYTSGLVDWDHRRGEVKQAFVTSWDAYAQHAWGK